MTLDPPLQDLLDRAAIDDLLTAYAECLDDRDWARLGALFTPDAELDFSDAYGIRAGRDEAVAWLAGQVTLEFAPVTQHHLTNRRWTRSDERASGTAEFFNPDILVEGGSRYILMNGGRYRFEAVRTEEGWRLSRLAATVLWSQRGEPVVFGDPSAT